MQPYTEDVIRQLTQWVEYIMVNHPNGLTLIREIAAKHGVPNQAIDWSADTDVLSSVLVNFLASPPNESREQIDIVPLLEDLRSHLDLTTQTAFDNTIAAIGSGLKSHIRGDGSVVADTIQGTVLTGEHARHIQTDQYVEQQEIGLINRGSIETSGGDLVIGNKIIGYTVEQVTVLLQELLTTEKSVVWDGRHPYMGLAAFQEMDAEFFFGRDALLDTLLTRVIRAQFICVAGPSGSGKSSLVQAGLFNALRQGRIDGSKKWVLAQMTPKGVPLQELGLALARTVKSPVAADYVQEHGLCDKTALHTQVETLLSTDPQQRFVLLVDQFEELFTQTRSETDRIAFIDLLTTAATMDGGRTNVLIALRSDFVSHCVPHPQLRNLISQEFQLVGAMDAHELAIAITRPALAVGATIEPELVSRVMLDMRGEPGALPLMQFALKDLFDEQAVASGESVALRLADYLDRGGMDQALERHANAIFAKLSTEQQRLARMVFSKLVEIGSHNFYTRRTVTLAELKTVDGEDEQLLKTINLLASYNARLITTGSTDVEEDLTKENFGGDSMVADRQTVTIAHEKLIDAWPWLHQLISESRDVIALQNQINDDARIWQEHGEDASYLYQGARLAFTRELLVDKQVVLSVIAQTFIGKSIAINEKQERSVRRRRQLWTVLLTTIGLLLLPALFLGSIVWMYYLRENSVWQSTRFPSVAVQSIAISPGPAENRGPQICLATSDIGIGCSRDGYEWNIYQIGFPVDRPNPLNNKNTWWGTLTGSIWETDLFAVEAIAFDRTDSQHLIALIESSGLYFSSDGGTYWQPISIPLEPNVSPPITQVHKIGLYKNYIYILLNKGNFSPLIESQRGALYASADNGIHWQMIGGPTLATGEIRDFYVAEEGDDVRLYIASEHGLFSTKLGTNGSWDKTFTVGDEGMWLIASSKDAYYWATLNIESKQGSIFRRNVNASGEVERLAKYDGVPKAMTADPDPTSEYPLWLLFEDNRVISFHKSGCIRERDYRPGWPWSFAYDLQILRNENGNRRVVMGHFDGFLEYVGPPDGNSNCALDNSCKCAN